MNKTPSVVYIPQASNKVENTLTPQSTDLLVKNNLNPTSIFSDIRDASYQLVDILNSEYLYKLGDYAIVVERQHNETAEKILEQGCGYGPIYRGTPSDPIVNMKPCIFLYESKEKSKIITEWPSQKVISKNPNAFKASNSFIEGSLDLVNPGMIYFNTTYSGVECTIQEQVWEIDPKTGESRLIEQRLVTQLDCGD